MTTLKLFLFIIGVLALATAGAFSIARASERADCPGQIECPLTGELVCIDRCPVEQGKVTTASARPSCCQKN